MMKFVELTDYEDQPLLVNVANILWTRPCEREEGTMIYMASPGKNNYPVNLYVKESYAQVTKLILK